MNDKRAIGRIYRMRIVWKIIRIQAKLWALQAVNNTEIWKVIEYNTLYNLTYVNEKANVSFTCWLTR